MLEKACMLYTPLGVASDLLLLVRELELRFSGAVGRRVVFAPQLAVLLISAKNVQHLSLDFAESWIQGSSEVAAALVNIDNLAHVEFHDAGYHTLGVIHHMHSRPLSIGICNQPRTRDVDRPSQGQPISLLQTVKSLAPHEAVHSVRIALNKLAPAGDADAPLPAWRCINVRYLEVDLWRCTRPHAILLQRAFPELRHIHVLTSPWRSVDEPEVDLLETPLPGWPRLDTVSGWPRPLLESGLSCTTHHLQLLHSDDAPCLAEDAVNLLMRTAPAVLTFKYDNPLGHQASFRGSNSWSIFKDVAGRLRVIVFGMTDIVVNPFAWMQHMLKGCAETDVICIMIHGLYPVDVSNFEERYAALIAIHMPSLRFFALSFDRDIEKRPIFPTGGFPCEPSWCWWRMKESKTSGRMVPERVNDFVGERVATYLFSPEYNPDINLDGFGGQVVYFVVQPFVPARIVLPPVNPNLTWDSDNHVRGRSRR
ncbi:predicted protein [Postia placenta Mad-698-R]|nr:predicted protein [Postia placenta Mad-698-R]